MPGPCSGRRMATVADCGAQRQGAPAVGDPEDPNCARHRRLRLEARQDRSTQSIGECVGGFARWRAATTHRSRMGVLDARWLPDGRHIAVVADAEPDAGMRRLSERAAAWRIAVDESAELVSLAELPGGVAVVRLSRWHSRRGCRQGLPPATLLGRQPSLRRRWRVAAAPRIGPRSPGGKRHHR